MKKTVISIKQFFTQQELGITCIKPIKGEIFGRFRSREIWVSNRGRAVSTDFQGRGQETPLDVIDTGNGYTVYVRRKHFDLHVKTDKENIHIEVNNYLEDYVRPRNMAFICNTYSREVLRGEEYDENTEFIQINLTYNMINEYKENNKFHDEKSLRIYKIRDDKGKNFVNNFTIYELNMDYYLNLWYSKNEELIEKYKYLIMLDLKPNELNILSKKDKVINKYMEEVERINEDPEFYEYISAEEDNRKIENSLKSQYKREGLEEGTRLAKLEDAKKMKEKGIDNSVISEVTGLTLEEIENL